MTEISTLTLAEPGRTTRRENPLLSRSTLPFEAPPFNEIRDDDYAPAMALGMEQHLAEIEAIAAQAAPPSFENTVVAMERSGRLLHRSASVFFIVASANSSDTLQETMEAALPRLAAHSDEIYLNDGLFRRVDSIYKERDQLSLAAEDRRLLERYHRDFVRAGALLNEADKARVRALNEEDAKLQAEFENRLREATRSAAVVLDDRAQLDGLSDIDIDAAAVAAKARGLDGKWLLPLQNTTQQPALQALCDRRLRERLFLASTQRAERGDDNDTRELVRRMARIRAERAILLGYANHAAYVLEEEMAHTPDARLQLLTSIASAAIRRAKQEQAAIQLRIDRDSAGFAVAPWDWQYYAERVRLAQFALDESLLKPYLELDRVLNDGVFYAATQLFGVTFRERQDLPVYHPDVRVFDVFDADGQQLALFYADLFKRDNKDGGAWSNEFVPAVGLLGTKAVVANVSNLTKPAPGQPALLSFDDVITLFHEFGHALHAMFARVQYPTLVATPGDFSEFPSQFNEQWALEPRVLAHYARHYETGTPMPDALVERFRRTRTFNQGHATTEYVAAALLDLAWHTLPNDAPPQDVKALETSVLTTYGFDAVAVPPRYHTSYFAHIWGGYAANYGAYMWAEVLDHDAWAWFEEHGGLTRENGDRYRRQILAVGNATDLAAAYRAFRGRDPDVEPLLAYRGLRG